MLNKTVTCDKCKKDITDLGRYEVIKKDCTEVPKAGQLVRYNCYAYVEEQQGENT